MNPTRFTARANFGDAWAHHQADRLHQRHLQFGCRCRLEVDALLDRVAGISRAVQTITVPSRRKSASTDPLRRATIEAIDYCAWIESQSSGDHF
jgi:hypothetical protein